MTPTDTMKDFDSPYPEPLQEKGVVRKPSQAEGEQDQPGDEKREPDSDPDFASPEKPSQAEGERKPYQ